MQKQLLLIGLCVLLASCTKRGSQTLQEQTGLNPFSGPAPAPTPTPSAPPSPTSVPSPTPSLSPSPTPVLDPADRLELNGPSNANINSCTLLSLRSRNATAPAPVSTAVIVSLLSSGYGSFFSDASCANTMTSVTLAPSQSDLPIYFRSLFGEPLTLTAEASGFLTATHSIEILGNASVDLQPSGFDFGSVKSGVVSSKSFVLNNSGNGIAKLLSFSAITLPFQIQSNTCGLELRAQSNCIIQISFSPTQVGTFSSSLNVNFSNQGTSTSFSLNLTGNSLTAGVLDPSFETGGFTIFPYTTSSLPTDHDQIYDLKVDNTGKIVAVGNTYNSTASPANYDMAIVRLNSNGTLDTTFNSMGKNRLDFGFTDGAKAVAIQNDSKILVGGYAYISSKFNFAIARFLPSGQIDPSFNTSGKITTPFTTSSQALAMVLTSSGKAVLAGNGSDSRKNSFALVRYNTNGSLDTSFGVSGKTITSFTGSTFETIQGITEDSSGNLIAVGYSSIGGLSKLALAKYDSTGNLVSSFGTSGTLLPSFPGNEASGMAVTVDASNSIYIVGKVTSGGNDNLLLMKFSSNGVTDNSFGTLGAVTVDLGTSQDLGTGISIDSSGKLLVSGYGAHTNVLRFFNNGQADASFGNNGRVETTMGNASSLANCLGFDSNAKILIGGAASTGNNQDFMLARFLP